MSRNLIQRSPAETQEDFRTDINPSLFMDNWGVDVIAEHGDKVKTPIDTAVALAQLMASIRSGEPVDTSTLDPEVLKGVAFVDGSDGEQDHFFSIGLEPVFEGGSYGGQRVAAKFMSGYVRLEPSKGSDETYAHYDERWSTLRGDVISGRRSALFEEDLRRMNNVLSVLEGASESDLATERPASWPNQPSSIRPSHATLTGLSIAENPIYVGEAPLADAGTEKDRKVHIPALDGPGPEDIAGLPSPSHAGEALALFAAIDARKQQQ